MNKIGICSWCLPFSGEELFQYVKSAGMSDIRFDFDYEKCKSPESRKAWCDEWIEFARKNDCQYSIMAINILVTYGMSKEENFEEIKKILESAIPAAAAIGVPCVHMPSFINGEIHTEAEFEQTMKCLEYAVELGEKYNVQIGHESVLSDDLNTIILDRIKSPVFFLLYDNENLLRNNLNPVTTYTNFAEIYRHAHLKLSNPETGMSELLANSEEFGGISAVLEAMKSRNFSGTIRLETDYKKVNDFDTMDSMIKEDIMFIQNILEKSRM